MASNKFVINESMANVDKLCKLRKRIAFLRKQENELADAVKVKIQRKGFFNGYEYSVELSTYDMTTLDPVKVAKLLSEKEMKRCMQTTIVEKLVFSKRD